MEWTFDPLEIKNAYFNLERLGAIARRYNVNQYGITYSPLQGSLPTDRLVAEWWMKSRRVATVLSSRSAYRYWSNSVSEVPHEIYEWKADPDDAQQGRRGARPQSRGIAVGVRTRTVVSWLRA